MKTTTRTIKVALCGPSDVKKEIEIAREEIDEWNLRNWEALDCGIRAVHWDTDAVPSMDARGQQIINRELIDKADLIVAVFWRRFGTPTGMHESGTAEEVLRAMAREMQVMIYFSDIEAPKLEVDPEQSAKLQDFRDKARNCGSLGIFRSRKQFREMFRQHLNTKVTELRTTTTKPPRKRKPKSIKQSATGDGNIQVAGEGNTVNVNPKSSHRPKIVIERSPDHLTPAEQQRVLELVEDLSILMETVQNKTTRQAKSELWSRLKNQFKVAKYEQIESARMPEVEAWYQGVRRDIQRKARRKAPGIYQQSKIPGIKKFMKEMGRANEDYYPEIAERLKMRPFSSLKDLSPKNLDRVYNLVYRDSKK